MTQLDVVALFKELKLRATPARIALLGALATAKAPKSAEELHARIQKGDLVTTYRNLQAFVESGIAHEVRFKDTTVRYEFSEGASHHHHHVICTTCGVIDELPACDRGIIEKKALTQSNTFASIEEHALEFFGTCRACVKQVGV